MFCKIFFADQFEALRDLCDFKSDYLESLSRCMNWEATGGKSGSNFMKTTGMAVSLILMFPLFNTDPI